MDATSGQYITDPIQMRGIMRILNRAGTSGLKGIYISEDGRHVRFDLSDETEF